MLIDGALNITGLRHMGEAYGNIKNQEYGKAIKNFAEGALRGSLTGLVTVIAIKALESRSRGIKTNFIPQIPFVTAKKFCSGLIEPFTHDAHESCVRNIIKQFPNKFFDVLANMSPNEAGEIGERVNKYCENYEGWKNPIGFNDCLNQMSTQTGLEYLKWFIPK